MDGRVFTQGDLDGFEHVMALRAKDGSVLWAVQPQAAAQAVEKRVETQFTRFDKDGDGILDALEAIEGLGRSAGSADSVSEGDKTEIAQKRTETLFDGLDENGDRKLTYLEFPRNLINEFSRIDSSDPDADVAALAEKRSKALMQKADADVDGKVTQQESRGTTLGFMFRRMDRRDPTTNRGDRLLTEEEIRTYFSTRERGKDGEVTVEELQRYFERFYPGRDGILSKDDLRRFYGGFRNGKGDGPRGTPTVDGNRVYTEGGGGDVMCLDAATGKEIWHVNLIIDFGGRRGGWGYSESPLIDGDHLIVTPGGNQGTVAALNKMTGELVWRSQEVEDGAHYSSPIAADVHGVHQIIQFTNSRVVGLNAETGKLLWEYASSANRTANACTPIYSDGFVFSSSAYGTGGGLVKIVRKGEAFEAEEVYFNNSMANHHGGIVLIDGFMYGFGNRGLICMDFETGDIAWRNRSVSKGSLCYADGDLYCLGERNQFALVSADSDEYVEKGRFSLPTSGRPTWAHPVVANGKLFFRDQNTLTCYDISATKQ